MNAIRILSKWMYNKIERLEIDGEELKSKLNGGGSGYGERN